MFVYTREAHPGEFVPHHDTFERKLESARRLRDDLGITREILVDDLAGTGHTAYGLLPNMTWVLTRGGRIAYKADWTNAAAVQAFLVRFLEFRDRRGPGTAIAPYQTEQLEYRHVDREAFYRHLAERNGPRALEEFHEAERIWGRR